MLEGPMPPRASAAATSRQRRSRPSAQKSSRNNGTPHGGGQDEQVDAYLPLHHRALRGGEHEPPPEKVGVGFPEEEPADKRRGDGEGESGRRRADQASTRAASAASRRSAWRLLVCHGRGPKARNSSWRRATAPKPGRWPGGWPRAAAPPPGSPPAECRRSRETRSKAEMCQRRQKTVGLCAMYGWLKFSTSSKPNQRAVPRAMSE